MTNSLSIDQLKQGDLFEIIHISGSGEIKRRLLDLGFVPGARGKRLRHGFFSDPIELMLGDYKISLRKSEAQNIITVKLLNVRTLESSLAGAIAGDRSWPEETALFDLQHSQVDNRGRFSKYFNPLTRVSMANGKAVVDHGNTDQRVIKVAVAGNPNTGKSTLYNQLTGSNVRVGNYSGVTVETKRTRIQVGEYSLELIDLPGIYSLTAYSFDEVVSRDFIINEKPDVVLNVLDATNLERNLFLCLQFQELGVPVVAALNMMDEVDKQGIKIDEKLLKELLHIPFVKTSALKKQGLDDLLKQVMHSALQYRKIKKNVLESDNGVRINNSEPIGRHLYYGIDVENYHNQLIKSLEADAKFASRYSLHWIAIKLLEDEYEATIKVESQHDRGLEILQQAKYFRSSLQKSFGIDPSIVIAQQRYGFIRGALKEAVFIPDHNGNTITEKIDRWTLHRYLGLGIFFGVMYLIYSFTFSLGQPLSDWMDLGFGLLGDWVTSVLPESMLRDLLVDGIIAGVGGVLVFLPFIVLLFLGLSFLEDSGYLARAAFVVDNIMHRFGLHGKSFVPMMIGTGCAVPAVMATRTLSSHKDRIVASMVLPMMMCSAKAPVVAIITAIFFSKNASLVFWLAWLLAWIIALVSALLLNKILFQGMAAPFVMELPPYRWPTFYSIVKQMWIRAMGYVKKAGTIILAASIITWYLFNFPRDQNLIEGYNKESAVIEQKIKKLESGDALPSQFSDNEAANNTDLQTDSQINSQINSQRKSIDALQAEIVRLENALLQRQIAFSYGGRVGKQMAKFFQVMGFDWKLSISLLAAMPAKEIVISTMGIVYGIGSVDDETGAGQGGSLRQAMQSDPNYNPVVAFAFIVFLLIYIPCLATLAMIKKELDGWRWVFLSAGFSFSVASVLAIAIYHLGTWLYT